MSNITILEHSSSSYAPRTYANAAKSDVTIALAVDYTTAGEKLTHKAAGDKYLKLDPYDKREHNAHLLCEWLYAIDGKVVNVAGNGIYTLTKRGVSQVKVNQYLLDVLTIVHEDILITKIVSGGQTGVDIAGGWAGVKLGIDVELLLPKGFKQRHEDGVDVLHTREEIMEQLYGNT
jgi:hypothetical protein